MMRGEKKIIIGVVIVLALMPAILAFKTQATLFKISVDDRGFLPKIDEKLLPNLPRIDNRKLPRVLPIQKDPFSGFSWPKPEPNRVDILLLGIRGIDDPYGGALTDAILIASLKKDTGRLALISIPRDLYVPIPGTKRYTKINEAYAWGRKAGGEKGGLSLAKKTLEFVTGVHIDYVARIDFTAFKEAIDAVGGIEIFLDKPFKEESQWPGEGGFFLPAGKNVLDGKTALYYVRSRFSTSDFDRAQRLQQVLLAFKDKALSLGVLANPQKILELLAIAGEHIRTDMKPSEITQYLALVPSLDFSQVKRKVFDTTASGHLVSAHLGSEYILWPKDGNWQVLRKDCQGIFED